MTTAIPQEETAPYVTAPWNGGQAGNQVDADLACQMEEFSAGALKAALKLLEELQTEAR